jgi:hypothetical protein
MTPRRTELEAFVLDLMDFIEEKVREALDNDEARAGAVAEAAGAVPVLRDRLRENESVLGQFLLLFGEQLDESQGPDWWRAFASMERTDFEKEAEDLLGTMTALRKAAAAATAS